jgi:hypothetical protein
MFGICKHILVLVLVVFAVSCKKDIAPEESQSEAYIKFFGGSPIDSARNLIIDGEQVIIAGTMKNTGAKAVLIGTDKNGNQKPWSPLFVGGQQSVAANKVLKTGDEGYIVVGTSQKSANNTDIFVSLISSAGVEEWTRFFGGDKNEEGLFGLKLSNGDYVVGGYTESSGYGLKDIYLIRIDSNGNLVWQSTNGTGENDAGNDIIEYNGWLYVLGYTESFVPQDKNSAIMFVIQVSIETLKGVNFNYFPKTEAYAGSKIGMLPDGKMVLLAVGNSSSYMNCINLDLSSAWELIMPTNEVYNNLAVKGDTVYMVGSKKTQKGNSNILIDQYNSDGGKIGSTVISSQGNQNATSVSFFPDGKIGLTGLNTVGSSPQIFLMKKEL